MLQVNFDPFPVITTERLVLRAITEKDAEDIFYLRTHDDLMRYIARPRPASVEDLLPLIQKIQNNVATNEGIAWAMTMKGDDRMMGHMSYHVLYKEHYRAEIGYMMRQEYHGQGIMDEAIKATIAYGFDKLGLHSIEAHVNPANAASRKLLERNNFTQEAYFKENIFWDGKFEDTVIYSRLAPRPA